MDRWTARTKARTELAEILRDRYMDRARSVGLTKKDLDDISLYGRKSEQADEEQKKEFVLIAAERRAHKALKESVFEREEGLRGRLRIILGDLLDTNEREAGRWLNDICYARYRFHEAWPTEVEPEEAENPAPKSIPDMDLIRCLGRIERVDTVTRARGLAALCHALLESGFDSIDKRLSARGYDAALLRTLGEDARRLVDMGPNVRRAAKATAIEAEAAKTQRNLWRRLRLLLRSAVKGVAELEEKWGEC